MSATAREIASQPEAWRAAVARAAEVRSILPQSGERALVVGCGTSLFIGQAYASLREAAGVGETDAVAASEFSGTRRYDRVLAISRSGTTTEILRLLAQMDGSAPTIAICADPGSPIVREVGNVVALGFANEASIVQTRFATSVLALLRSSLGQDMDRAIADAGSAIDEPLPIDPSAFDHFVFLGHGWTVGLANEAALKMRETSRSHAESYPAMEYRHGPISLAGEQTCAWLLGFQDPALGEEIRGTGATVVFTDRDPMAELILIQRSAVALASALGLDPDNPRNLTRSVVLS